MALADEFKRYGYKLLVTPARGSSPGSGPGYQILTPGNSTAGIREGVMSADPELVRQLMQAGISAISTEIPEDVMARGAPWANNWYGEQGIGGINTSRLGTMDENQFNIEVSNRAKVFQTLNSPTSGITQSPATPPSSFPVGSPQNPFTGQGVPPTPITSGPWAGYVPTPEGYKLAPPSLGQLASGAATPPQVVPPAPVSTYSGKSLNVAQSVVDYLKSKGVDSSYTNREKIYYNLGLDKTLGSYTGSPNQNPAIIQALSSQERNLGVTISPNNFSDVMNVSGSPSGTSTRGTPATDALGYLGSPAPQDLAQAFQAETAKYNLTDEQKKQAAYQQVMGEPTLPIRYEQADAEKVAIRLKGQQTTEKFLQDIAKSGMAFSGKRTVGEAAITAETIAQQLGIDRSTALLVATGLETAMQNVAKDALKGQQGAISALDKMGYVVLGDKVMQKPSEARAAEDQQFQQQNQLMAEERLRLSEASAVRAQQAQDRSNQYLAIAIQNQTRMANQDLYGKLIPVSKFSAAAGIVGLRDTQAADLFTSTGSETPPTWFRQQYGDFMRQSVQPNNPGMSVAWKASVAKAQGATTANTPFEQAMIDLTNKLNGK